MNKDINIKSLIINKPLRLDCGQTINNFPLAYETYGTLNIKKDNAVLVFHALTGDQFVSGLNPLTKKDGWWSYAVGPGKAIDTNKYFVLNDLKYRQLELLFLLCQENYLQIEELAYHP